MHSLNLGVGTFITNQKSGLLVQLGDSYSITACIVEVGQHPLRAQEMGRVAREEAISRHQPEKIVRDLCSTYESIVQSH